MGFVEEVTGGSNSCLSISASTKNTPRSIGISSGLAAECGHCESRQGARASARDCKNIGACLGGTYVGAVEVRRLPAIAGMAPSVDLPGSVLSPAGIELASCLASPTFGGQRGVTDAQLLMPCLCSCDVSHSGQRVSTSCGGSITEAGSDHCWSPSSRSGVSACAEWPALMWDDPTAATSSSILNGETLATSTPSLQSGHDPLYEPLVRTESDMFSNASRTTDWSCRNKQAGVWSVTHGVGPWSDPPCHGQGVQVSGTPKENMEVGQRTAGDGELINRFQALQTALPSPKWSQSNLIGLLPAQSDGDSVDTAGNTAAPPISKDLLFPHSWEDVDAAHVSRAFSDRDLRLGQLLEPQEGENTGAPPCRAEGNSSRTGAAQVKVYLKTETVEEDEEDDERVVHRPFLPETDPTTSACSVPRTSHERLFLSCCDLDTEGSDQTQYARAAPFCEAPRHAAPTRPLTTRGGSAAVWKESLRRLHSSTESFGVTWGSNTHGVMTQPEAPGVDPAALAPDQSQAWSLLPLVTTGGSAGRLPSPLSLPGAVRFPPPEAYAASKDLKQ
eukprot:GHVT01025770.1.p1 GENE.GHVT01025770.1~~GHVT01025770.1.p1  ORF type:complete len:559 (+),score=60.41 GHVT01025770.1:2288-3964(+)